MGDTLLKGLSERLNERLGEIVCKRLCEMLDPNMLQASSRIQEGLNLSQLPSPVKALKENDKINFDITMQH